MLASEVIAELGRQLNDVDQVTWTTSSLVDYMNSAQQIISSMRPDAFSIIEVVQLQAGSKQALPASGRRLLDIKRNMGTDGLTPGRIVDVMEEDAIDLFDYGWQTNTQTQEILNYHYNERVPDIYYVDPPSDGFGWVEVYMSVIPTIIPDPPTLGFVLDASDIYRNQVIQWCMYRAYSIEIDSISSQQRATYHYNQFMNMMQEKFGAEVQFSPSEEVSVRAG